MNRSEDLGDDKTVYVHENWDVYHIKLGCALSKGTKGGIEAIDEMEKSDAEDNGNRPCDSCVNNPWLGKEGKLKEIHRNNRKDNNGK